MEKEVYVFVSDYENSGISFSKGDEMIYVKEESTKDTRWMFFNVLSGKHKNSFVKIYCWKYDIPIVLKIEKQHFSIDLFHKLISQLPMIGHVGVYPMKIGEEYQTFPNLQKHINNGEVIFIINQIMGIAEHCHEIQMYERINNILDMFIEKIKIIEVCDIGGSHYHYKYIDRAYTLKVEHVLCSDL